MNQYVELLDALCEKFGIAVDWTQGNVVPYVQQLTSKYVNYKICISVACIITFVIVFCIISATLFLMNKYANKRSSTLFEYFDNDFSMILFVALFILLLISLIGIVANSFNIVTALTFPEKLVLEYLKSMS